MHEVTAAKGTQESGWKKNSRKKPGPDCIDDTIQIPTSWPTRALPQETWTNVTSRFFDETPASTTPARRLLNFRRQARCGELAKLRTDPITECACLALFNSRAFGLGSECG